jgi:anthranilate phosphoribosyltransferase
MTTGAAHVFATLNCTFTMQALQCRTSVQNSVQNIFLFYNLHLYYSKNCLAKTKELTLKTFTSEWT